MRIRIKNGNCWYTDEVGNEFDVIRMMDGAIGIGYVVNEGSDGVYWVDIGDAEEI
jgi:hypothetical protein